MVLSEIPYSKISAIVRIYLGGVQEAFYFVKSKDRPIGFCTDSDISKNLKGESKGQTGYTHAEQIMGNARFRPWGQGWVGARLHPLQESSHYGYLRPGVRNPASGLDS